MLCRYRKASARVHIFQDRPRPGSMTPSEASDDDRDDEILPEVSLRFNNTYFVTSSLTYRLISIREHGLRMSDRNFRRMFTQEVTALIYMWMVHVTCPTTSQ